MIVDITTVAISAFVWVAGSMAFLYAWIKGGRRTFADSLRGVWGLGIMSFAIILVSVLINSVVERDLGGEFVLSFLAMKVAGPWSVRVLLSFGYVYLLWTGELLVLALVSRDSGIRKGEHATLFL